MNPSLQQSIESVYAAFQDVPRPVHIDGCCIDDKGISILLSKPLRHLSPDDLTHYSASIFLTVGDIPDFLYFLPRILEILSSDSHWWPDPEVVTKAIQTSEFDSWPQHRQKAVLDYFDSVLNNLLISGDDIGSIDSWICALGRLFPDITGYLSRISRHPKRVVEYYEVNSEQLIKGKLANSFWDDAPETQSQVIEWFNSPAIRKTIDKVYGLSQNQS